MNHHQRNHDQESQYCCNIHPSQVIIGICSLCLKERLLILASSSSTSTKQEKHTLGSNSVIQKVSALSNSLLHRLNSHRQQKFDSTDKDTSSTSQEDSFISIKFEDNGCAAWDKGNDHQHSNLSLIEDLKISSNDNHKVITMNKKMISSSSTTIVEHKGISTTPRGGMLRWRKRVGQLFQLALRSKSRSSMANVCHVNGSNLDQGVKIRKVSWIKSTLTKRRKKQGHETKGVCMVD